MGTSGSFVGTARRLKYEDPRVKTLAVQPASPFHGIEGTKHMGSSIKPGILDETLFDDVFPSPPRRPMRARDASPGGTAFLSVFHLAQMLPPPPGWPARCRRVRWWSRCCVMSARVI
jgi:hypothetical protein